MFTLLLIELYFGFITQGGSYDTITRNFGSKTTEPIRGHHLTSSL